MFTAMLLKEPLTNQHDRVMSTGTGKPGNGPLW
jgi:hypothetical protein